VTRNQRHIPWRLAAPLLVVGAALALASGTAGVSAAGQAAPQQQPTRPPAEFRSGIEVVSLNVAVMDGPRFVTDLEPEEFQVFEDGALQEVKFFSRSNLPIALSLLIDTSASMETRLATAQEAAIGFARRLRDQDLAEIVDFDSRVEILQPFTNDRAAIEQSIRRTAAGGSTSMYNAVYIALKDLKRVVATSAEEIRRQAIVLLSDGEDTSSLLPFEEVLDLAKRSETVIYAIGLRSTDLPSSRRQGFNEAEFVLRQLSQETGGRAFFPGDIKELAGIYDKISEDLSSQYTLGYTSRNARADGTWRRIAVRVKRPNLTTRTKQGYFAPTP
jgi:Ca-activated chloride channel family protein